MNSQQHFPGVTLPAPIRTGLTVHECYVDSGDAAKFLKVARSTVAHWARQGMIPAHPSPRRTALMALQAG